MPYVNKFKRTATPGYIPQTYDLQLGEIVINTNSGKIYTKKDDGVEAIVEVGVGGYVLPTASAGTLGGVKVGTNLSINGSGVLAATPSGSTTQVQFNDAGVTAGDSGFTYDKTAKVLTVQNGVTTSDLIAQGTTEQMRLGYDVSNYLSATIGSSGEATLAATGGTITIKGTTATDGPTLGSELLTTAGWTVPGGWTESPDDVFTHSNGGGTSALSHSVAISSATKYLVTWTITGRTTGSITIALGGQSFGSQTATAGFGPTTSSTAGFTITPTNDFDGVVSAVSLKTISGIAKSVIILKNNANSTVYESRANSGVSNIFVGVSAGRYCVGSVGSTLSAFGSEALAFATTATSVSAFGYRAGYSTTTARSCAFFGSMAGNNVTSGTEHTFVGSGAGFSVVASTGNSCVGYASGYNFTAGQNSCLGGYSGRYQADGSTALVGSQLSCYIGYNTKGFNDSDIYSIVIGANAVGLGASTTVLGTINQTTAATIYGAGTFSLTNATTNAAVTVGSLIKNVTGAGVGAAGLGPRLLFGAESSTSTGTTQADITATWTDATHATRKTRLALSAYDTAAREGIRIEADGTAPRLGFFGATAVTKPVALSTQLTSITFTTPGAYDYAISDLTQTSPYGFVTADEGRTVLAVIANLQARVAQLELKLQALGLLS